MRVSKANTTTPSGSVPLNWDKAFDYAKAWNYAVSSTGRQVQLNLRRPPTPKFELIDEQPSMAMCVIDGLPSMT